MKIYKTVRGLQNAVRKHRENGKKIGFVPTLGALHRGHMSLLEKANQESDISIVSIFVNPTQFNDPEDLKKYPRPYEKDVAMLKEYDCNILFYPEVDQMYPKDLDITLDLDFEKLDETMEGAFRPGHFNGVAQVVKRLLDIVLPDRLYMGQKDFQQTAIIRSMMRQTGLDNVALVICSIIREDHGLAMSSRNARLSPKARKDASIIYKTLQWVKENLDNYTIDELEGKGIEKLRIDGFRPEYFQIVEGFHLDPINHLSDSEFVVACTAVWVEDVRLIDNIILKNEANL